MNAPPSAIGDPAVYRLMFEYETLDRPTIERLCAPLPMKLVRWMGINHPDNRTRKLFYELTNVRIGEGTVLNAGLILQDEYAGLVSFGERVAVATNVTIVACSNPNNSRLDELAYVREHLNCSTPIHIGDDAWLGTNAVILPGAQVGAGAIVGAGAVVTHSVPDFSVVAGVPARVIRHLDPLRPVGGTP